MAKPDNVIRFFRYLDTLRQGLPLSHEQVSEPFPFDDREIPAVQKRQFLDDMAFLRQLLPLWQPGTGLDSTGDGRYQLSRSANRVRLSEAEFLPFLKALAQTTNLFPYPVDGWLGVLNKTYAHPVLDVLEQRILYTSTPHPDRLKPQHFHLLVQSLVERRRVDLTYRNREGVERKVDFEPMTFLNHNGVWYLVGDGIFAHRGQDETQPTQLKLARLGLCALSDRPYRDRFDWKGTVGRLKGTYGSHLIMNQDKKPQQVSFRFFGNAVRHVRESWFHVGQDLELNGDGSCDLHLQVNDLFDALQLAGQWGELCRPTAPPELVTLWKEKARAVAQWAGSDSV